ncbi:MAG: hypothetical protein U0167_17475 [bacterium]
MSWALLQVHAGPGSVTDFTFMLTWPAAFTALAWLVIALPALRQPFFAARLGDPKTSWLAWPLLALLAYGLLVATWLHGGTAALLGFPLIEGAVAGLLFPALRRSAAHPALVAAAPVALVLACAFVVWPGLERVSPYTTYVYGADDSRSRSLERILRRVHAGDSFADLSARYPKIFPQEALHMLGNSGAGGHGFTYRVEFDHEGGSVTRVEVARRNSP